VIQDDFHFVPLAVLQLGALVISLIFHWARWWRCTLEWILVLWSRAQVSDGDHRVDPHGR
jgi:hypothetical protein